jgi:thioester reductase-like protein
VRVSSRVGSSVADHARGRVARVVADFLKIDPAAIDPHMPLVLYGLDSVGSMELVAELERALERELPEWLLLEHPDLEALVRALEEAVRLKPDATQITPPRAATTVASGAATTVASGFSRTAELQQMLADSILPADIRPPAAGTAGTESRILLTGATGFLGAYLLRDLLDMTDAEIWCLVRGTDADSSGRIAANLARYGLNPRTDGRIHAVGGDLTLPGFGLRPSLYRDLSELIDAIYHVAADVNWVLPYGALRRANVVGTRELLRLACTHRSKAFHFISSLSVCYATGGPAIVGEDDDMLPHVDRLPLGYAQSKCVAESLTRQAALRGLPIRIHRPPLIVGDSRSGTSNLDDLVALLIKGCVQMGTAPDLDWTFDAMPVDFVSSAIVRLGQDFHHQGHWHLHHPQPRHWRECVLWMNMFGYSVRLVPYQQWQQHLTVDSSSPQHALHPLRSFFLRPRDEGIGIGGSTVPELYQEGRRSAVTGDVTRRAMATLGLEYPRLDAELFDRYFVSYLSRGFLPQPAQSASTRPTKRTAGCHEDPRFLEGLLRRHSGDPGLRVRSVSINPIGTGHSVISELTSWRRQRSAGLFKCQLTIERTGTTDPECVDLVIKAKPSDRDAIDVGQTVAAMCDERLERAFREYRERIGLAGSHLRELAVYEHADVRVQRYLPQCFGTWRNDECEEWGLALEHLQSLTLLNAVDQPKSWSRPHIDSVISGLSDLHAIWYGREPALQNAVWLDEGLSRARACELTPLWGALAAHAAPYFRAWVGPSMTRTHRQLVDSIDKWWQPLEQQPRTLIHNDFSPRNVALRQDDHGFRLCAYDWELATPGPPQRDLAEFLCFVLHPGVSLHEVDCLVERHRHLLETAAATSIPRDPWREGFRSALADLLIDKLAFYALVNRVRSQPYLPRVLRTWQRLFTLFSQRVDE